MSETSKSATDKEPTTDHETDASLPDELKEVLTRTKYSEEEQYEQPEECYCSFFDDGQLISPTLSQYKQQKLKDAQLFQDIYTLDSNEELMCVDKRPDDIDDSILVTGFGIRNLASLQHALRSDRKKKLLAHVPTEEASEASEAFPEQRSARTEPSQKSTETETDISSVTSDISSQQDQLRYLMGLQGDAGEEEYVQKDILTELIPKESEDKFIFAQTSTMKSAQMYLRTHRIFDFFQFIIAHLLSAGPDNPINFILVLLNKILLYRAGTGKPPLLYDQKHIEQLFKLMDRMGTGYIELKQYVSGMKTLGICEYNKEPLLSEEGLVSMEVFVQEALESETALFNDLIKRKWTGKKPKQENMFLERGSLNVSFLSGTNFIPSDLMLKSTKHFPSADVMGNDGAE